MLATVLGHHDGGCSSRCRKMAPKMARFALCSACAMKVRPYAQLLIRWQACSCVQQARRDLFRNLEQLTRRWHSEALIRTAAVKLTLDSMAARRSLKMLSQSQSSIDVAQMLCGCEML